MMTAEDDSNPTASSLLRDLDSVRQRVERAKAWMSSGKTTVAATALAEEVQRLCREVSLCDDARRAGDLLATAAQRLRDLEKLLGVH
ncbi:MAG: hypothetical protein ACFCUQ_19925 [Kiloniellales bacterium]